MNHALQWMKVCAENHVRCNLPVHSLSQPSRLLELDFDPTVPTFRLIEPAMGFDRPYNTLSHCWGGGDILKLKADNKSEFENWTPVRSLPRTFRQACRVSNFMGVRYIWIDSLCIMQEGDLGTEWLTESSKMDCIYGGAYCNLAADASDRPSKGLFRNHGPQTFEEDWIDLHPTGPRSLLAPGQWRLFCDEFYWENRIEHAPLNRRAWVLQERYLARRVLHFTGDELIWECWETAASEKYPDGIHHALYPTKFKNTESPGTRELSLQPGRPQEDLSRAHLIESWHNIQKRFSNTQLTRFDDKMVAISGIAKRFEKLLADNYVAGMWRSRLHADLLWTTGLWKETPECLLRAPSFSWLSVQTPISTCSQEREDYPFDVIDIQVQPLTSDHTGSLISGRLTLRGYLFRFGPMETPLAHDDTQNFEFKHLDVRCRFSPDRLPLPHPNGQHFVLFAAEGGGRSPDFRTFMALECVDKSLGTFRRTGSVSSQVVGSSDEKLEIMLTMEKIRIPLPLPEL